MGEKKHTSRTVIAEKLQHKAKWRIKQDINRHRVSRALSRLQIHRKRHGENTKKEERLDQLNRQKRDPNGRIGGNDLIRLINMAKPSVMRHAKAASAKKASYSAKSMTERKHGGIALRNGGYRLLELLAVDPKSENTVNVTQRYNIVKRFSLFLLFFDIKRNRPLPICSLGEFA